MAKYFENEDVDPVGSLYQQIGFLTKRISDLERELHNQYSMQALPRVDPLTYPNPYEGMRAVDPADEQHMWYSNGEWRKAAGIGMYEIKVFEDQNDVIVEDGAFWWPIPNDLDGAEIVYADGGVSTESSSGAVQVQIAHQPLGVGALTDILSTKISIAPGDKGATPGVVSGGSFGPLSSVAEDKDWLRIDVDAAGTGAKGLAVIVGVIPSPIGSVTVQGSQGPPGGVNNWTGAWNSGTTYNEGDSVSNNGSSYVAIQTSTNVEPGVDAGWENYWQLLTENARFGSLMTVINGNGYTLDPGIKAFIPIPFDGTIVEATLLADIAGSIVIDVWKDTYGAFPPTNADSITGSSPPTLIGADHTTDVTLSGWTTAVAAGDVLIFNIDSCVAITRVTLALRIERS